jgi:anti-sigma28 factor (negative regulator of flagellin synthesis)
MQSVAEKRNKFRIQAPSEKTNAQKDREEVRKYLRLIPTEAEPSLGRVREIKEEIKNGSYLTREIIEEAAMQLALRLLRKEKD